MSKPITRALIGAKLVLPPAPPALCLTDLPIAADHRPVIDHVRRDIAGRELFVRGRARGRATAAVTAPGSR